MKVFIAGATIIGFLNNFIGYDNLFNIYGLP
jgi:hypothetical protein